MSEIRTVKWIDAFNEFMVLWKEHPSDQILYEEYVITINKVPVDPDLEEYFKNKKELTNQ